MKTKFAGSFLTSHLYTHFRVQSKPYVRSKPVRTGNFQSKPRDQSEPVRTGMFWSLPAVQPRYTYVRASSQNQNVSVNACA